MPKRKACAGCQHLRARCVENCILAPYFPASDKDRFHRVIRIFGVRGAKRMLQALPTEERKKAADCMAEEAYWRLKEPTKGYMALVQSLKEELDNIRKEIAETREWFGLDVTETYQEWDHSEYLSDDESLEPLKIEKRG